MTDVCEDASGPVEIIPVGMRPRLSLLVASSKNVAISLVVVAFNAFRLFWTYSTYYAFLYNGAGVPQFSPGEAATLSGTPHVWLSRTPAIPEARSSAFSRAVQPQVQTRSTSRTPCSPDLKMWISVQHERRFVDTGQGERENYARSR